MNLDIPIMLHKDERHPNTRGFKCPSIKMSKGWPDECRDCGKPINSGDEFFSIKKVGVKNSEFHVCTECRKQY